MYVTDHTNVISLWEYPFCYQAWNFSLDPPFLAKHSKFLQEGRGELPSDSFNVWKQKILGEMPSDSITFARTALCDRIQNINSRSIFFLSFLVDNAWEACVPWLVLKGVTLLQSEFKHHLKTAEINKHFTPQLMRTSSQKNTSQIKQFLHCSQKAKEHLQFCVFSSL